MYSAIACHDFASRKSGGQARCCLVVRTDIAIGLDSMPQNPTAGRAHHQLISTTVAATVKMLASVFDSTAVLL